MPTVPFSGVPSIAPGGDPTPRYTADVSPDTFGANVAIATQGLGKALDSAGGEIFARGLAMQDLYNHSEAQKADADYMEKAGLLHANYSALQGKAAVDAYPQYINDLKDARKGIRDGLSNQMSQKLYDSQSLSTMGRTIFNGAGHAATQNKAYAVSAADGRIAASGDAALAMPNDDKAFQSELINTEANIRAKSQLMGQAPEAEDEAVAQGKSALWGQRIKGLVKQQPIQAGKMLEQAIKDGEVRGADIGALTNIVQQARNTVGARMVSNQVMTGAGNRYGVGPVDIKQAGEAIGQYESGNNYSTQGPEVFDKKTGASRGQALGKYQVMPENLPEWLAQAGLPSMTPAEFLKNHAAQDQVFATVFGGYMKRFGSFNAAAKTWFTGNPNASDDVTDAQPGVKGHSAGQYLAATNAILAKNAPLATQVDMGRTIANEQAPEDPLFQDAVQQRITTDRNMNLTIKRDDEFRNRQTIETGLMGGPDGKLPTTVEELTADPKAAAAWDDLLPSTQRRYMGVLARNAKGDVAWSEDRLRESKRLQGMADTNPAEFIDQDIPSMDLPYSARNAFIKLQGQLQHRAEGDPRVGRALDILAQDMLAAGIDEKKNKDEYYQFAGAVSDQLKQFADENKRPPKIDEVKLIGSRLMQQKETPGWLWGTNKVPTYQIPVPSKDAEAIKADPAWAGLGITPTDQQIQRIYTNKMYQELHGGSVKAKPNAPVAQ